MDIPRDIIYTFERFDVLAWWKGSKEVYPKLYVTAMLVLSKPITNAFQERCFSAVTWRDTLMNQSMTEATFEMVMIYYY